MTQEKKTGYDHISLFIKLELPDGQRINDSTEIWVLYEKQTMGTRNRRLRNNTDESRGDEGGTDCVQLIVEPELTNVKRFWSDANNIIPAPNKKVKLQTLLEAVKPYSIGWEGCIRSMLGNLVPSALAGHGPQYLCFDALMSMYHVAGIEDVGDNYKLAKEQRDDQRKTFVEKYCTTQFSEIAFSRDDWDHHSKHFETSVELTVKKAAGWSNATPWKKSSSTMGSILGSFGCLIDLTFVGFLARKSIQAIGNCKTETMTLKFNNKSRKMTCTGAVDGKECFANELVRGISKYKNGKWLCLHLGEVGEKKYDRWIKIDEKLESKKKDLIEMYEPFLESLKRERVDLVTYPDIIVDLRKFKEAIGAEKRRRMIHKLNGPARSQTSFQRICDEVKKASLTK